MKIFSIREKGFIKILDVILKRGESDITGAEEAVKAILKDVRQSGDKSLLKYTELFDGIRLKNTGLRVTKRDIKKAIQKISKTDLNLIKLAAKRIEAFHKRQSAKSWAFSEKDGTILGQMIKPIERVGIYVPGGKAVYPSTVLMNAIPAKIAGVKEVVMVTPPGT